MTFRQMFFLGTALMLSLNSNAQNSGIKLFTMPLDTGYGNFDPCEPSIAINQKVPDNIVVATVLNRIFWTKNGGQSWNLEHVTSPYGVYGDPVVVSDSNGHFYFFHLSDPSGQRWKGDEILDRMVCQVSRDGGKTWTEGTYVGHNPPKDQDKEWATVNPITNEIYLTWTQFDKYGSTDSTCESNIFFSKYDTEKAIWSRELRINELSGDCLDKDSTTEGALTALGSQGEIFSTWSFGDKIYFDKSLDGGESWMEKDIVVGDQNAGWSIDLPGLNRSNGMPVVQTDLSHGKKHGRIYVVWLDQEKQGDNTNVLIASSDNQGDSWSKPRVVNKKSNRKHQFLTWMTIDQKTGDIYIMYYGRTDDNLLLNHVFLAQSKNNGKSFKEVQITNNAFKSDPELFFGDYSHLVFQKDRLAMTYTIIEKDKTNVQCAIIDRSDLDKLF